MTNLEHLARQTADKALDALWGYRNRSAETQREKMEPHILAALKSVAEQNARDGVCVWCGEMTSCVAGDPHQWPMWFPEPNGTGEDWPHHTGCVMKRLQERDRLHAEAAALRSACSEALKAIENANLLTGENWAVKQAIRDTLKADAGTALLRELEGLRAAKSHMESCRALIGAREDETLHDAISDLRERVSHPIATVISNEQAARIIVSLADLPAVVRVLNSLTDPRDSAYIDLRERVKKAEWQPIATAPKDGTYILLWWTVCDSPSVGHWDTDPETRSGLKAGWRSLDDDCIPKNQHHCTHWQPLPQPPTALEGQ